jgi:Mg2+ and Co2+ transporter CorA
MNKILSIILITLAIALIAYNVTLINFENPLEGDSIIAIIGIVASLCAIVLLLIFIASKKIQEKVDEN